MTRAAYAKWVPVIGREPLPMKADYDRAVCEHDIDLLFVDGRMVALLEVMIRPDHLWIENLAVAPDDQRRGWGRHLLAHAERKALAAGCGAIRLLTNGAFAANVVLYQRAGYIIDRTEPFAGGTTVYMSKQIG